MKGIIIALIIGAGGYYYLINYYYAPKQNEYLDKYLEDENKSDEDDTLFVEDPNEYDNQIIKNKREAKESKASDDSKVERELMVNQGNYEGSSETYKCDGRTKCIQMNSCLEARFFLANCPGIEGMDPDKNGVPCETNLCGGTIF